MNWTKFAFLGWRVLLIALLFLAYLYLSDLVASRIIATAIEFAAFSAAALAVVLPPIDAERRVLKVLENLNR